MSFEYIPLNEIIASQGRARQKLDASYFVTPLMNDKQLNFLASDRSDICHISKLSTEVEDLVCSICYSARQHHRVRAGCVRCYESWHWVIVTSLGKG